MLLDKRSIGTFPNTSLSFKLTLLEAIYTAYQNSPTYIDHNILCSFFVTYIIGSLRNLLYILNTSIKNKYIISHSVYHFTYVPKYLSEDGYILASLQWQGKIWVSMGRQRL